MTIALAMSPKPEPAPRGGADQRGPQAERRKTNNLGARSAATLKRRSPSSPKINPR